MFKYVAIAALMLSSTAEAAPFEAAQIAEQIQNQVNADIKVKTDSNGLDNNYDSWELPTKYGDCEDFALLKRQLLIEAGFDPSDLEILIVTRAIDKRKSNVVYAHVILKIKSLELVLDYPAQRNRDSVLKTYTKKTPTEIYSNWMQDNGAKFYCKVTDLTLSDKIPTIKRCED